MNETQMLKTMINHQKIRMYVLPSQDNFFSSEGPVLDLTGSVLTVSEGASNNVGVTKILRWRHVDFLITTPLHHPYSITF